MLVNKLRKDQRHHKAKAFDGEEEAGALASVERELDATQQLQNGQEAQQAAGVQMEDELREAMGSEDSVLGPVLLRVLKSCASALAKDVTAHMAQSNSVESELARLRAALAEVTDRVQDDELHRALASAQVEHSAAESGRVELVNQLTVMRAEILEVEALLRGDRAAGSTLRALEGSVGDSQERLAQNNTAVASIQEHLEAAAAGNGSGGEALAAAQAKLVELAQQHERLEAQHKAMAHKLAQARLSSRALDSPPSPAPTDTAPCSGKPVRELGRLTHSLTPVLDAPCAGCVARRPRRAEPRQG